MAGTSKAGTSKAGTSKKLIIAGLVAASLFVLVVVGVLFNEFDSPQLGRLALGQIGKASGFDLEARSFRLNLLRRLRVLCKANLSPMSPPSR